MDDETALIVSLSENVQRGDLGEEDIVGAYLILQKINPKRWTQAEFAKKLGKSQGWVSQSITAYEALQKLRNKGLEVSMKAYPRKEERDKGALPVRHLRDVETAIRSPEIMEMYPEEEDRDDKRIEIITAVKDLPHEDAKKVVDRFKMYPEREISSIKDQVESRKTGVQIGKTYLPPKVARQLDELAESKHTSMEEVLPEVVERGLSVEQTTLVEVDEEEEKEKLPALKLEVPISVQLHEQRIWNLQQLFELDPSKFTDSLRFDVITVGFSQKTVEDMIKAFKIAGVKILVDIRKNPHSQYKTEFNKGNLSSSLKREGIEYKHFEMLGIPRPLRNRAFSGEITKEELFDIYDKEILTDGFLDTLEELIESKETIALLCTEISPLHCHRHRVALALKERGRVTYDI
jgi:transcriptional regulator with XRE-family HTH domain